MDDMLEYMSCPEVAKNGAFQKGGYKNYAKNRIPDVSKIGYMWLIPKDAEKPTDKRYKSFISRTDAK